MKRTSYRPNRTLKAVISIIAFMFLLGGIIGCVVNENQPAFDKDTDKKIEENINNNTGNDSSKSDEADKVTNDDEKSSTSQDGSSEDENPPSGNGEAKAPGGQVEVHYIDVGQADSILIKCDGKYMLIDAGNNADSSLVVDYVKAQGISKLDYLVGTHPHEDHIGGLDAVIDSFDIGTLYMPKATATTKTFKDVVAAAKNKKLSFTTPVVGSTFDVGGAKCTILAPNSEKYDDTNDYSIVIRMVYGSTSFLFTGDAEAKSEKEMLKNNLDLSADVLKVGHHGSSTSSSEEFLNRVNPKYAVISVGVDNDYNHPKQSTLDRFKTRNVPVYRTDECGTVIATSDGTGVEFNVSPGSYKGKK